MSRLTQACEYDHALKNEAFGLYVSLASVSACHLTDYVVEPGLVSQFAPGREKDLLDVLRSGGLITNVQVKEKSDDGHETAARWLYKLTNDPDFVHMRLKKEVEIDRNRKKDSRNPDVYIPVRVRDGDQCRWCGKSVNFADHRSARGGTIDSLNSHENSTVDNLVVACRACNAGREQAPDEYTLRPAPSQPWYLDSTVRWVNTHKWAIANGVHITGDQQELPIEEGNEPSQKLIGLDDPIDQAPSWAQPNQEQAAAEQQPAADPTFQAARRPQQAPHPVVASATQAAPEDEGAQEVPAAPQPSTSQPAGQRDLDPEAEPVWMHKSVEEIRQEQAAAEQQPAADPTFQAARRPQQAPHPVVASATQAAPEDEGAQEVPAAPQLEGNETVKPNADPIATRGRQGDDPGLSGTGRVGSGRGMVGSGRNRKKRGRRAGRLRKKHR